MLKCVFSLYISRALIKAGYQPVKIELNNEDPDYLVFKFNATDELLAEFDRIKSEHLQNIA